MDRQSKLLLIPTGVATSAGLGLGQMTNVLQPYWPETPHWVFAFLFWSGAAFTFLPLPFWLIWLAWKNRRTCSRRWRMIFGLILVCGGCAMGVVGLSIVAAGDAPAPKSSPLQTTLAPPPSSPTQSYALQQDQAALPTIDFIDSARPNVRTNTIIGSPPGVLRFKNTTDANVENNFMSGALPTPTLPEPTGEFSSLSSEGLRDRLAAILARLRTYQDSIDKSQHPLPTVEVVREEFDKKFRNECVSILSAMFKRTGPVPPPSAANQGGMMRAKLAREAFGFRGIFYNFSTTDLPGNVADYLSYVAERLPP